MQYLESDERPPSERVGEARRVVESVAGPDFTVSKHMELNELAIAGYVVERQQVRVEAGGARADGRARYRSPR